MGDNDDDFDGIALPGAFKPWPHPKDEPQTWQTLEHDGHGHDAWKTLSHPMTEAEALKWAARHRKRVKKVAR